MTNFAIGFAACYVLLTILYNVFERGDRVIDCLLCDVWVCIAFVCALPFIFIWHFIHVAIVGTTNAQLEWAKARSELTTHHLVGPFYLGHEHTPAKPWNKFFLIRVKKS